MQYLIVCCCIHLFQNEEYAINGATPVNQLHAEPILKPLLATASPNLSVRKPTQSSNHSKSGGDTTPVVPPRGKKSGKKTAPKPPEIAVNTAKRSESESSTDSNMSTDSSNNLKVRKRDSDRDRRKGRVGSDLVVQLEAYINSQEHTYDEVNSGKNKKVLAPPCHLDDNAVAKLNEFSQGRRIDVLDILREEGERLGMGLNIQHTKGPNSVIQGVFVKNVNPEGAADRAEGASKGLCAGDELLAVNGDILREKTYTETVKLLSDLPLNVQVVVARERDYDDVETDRWLTKNAENALQPVKLNENQLWMKIEKHAPQMSPHTSMKNLDQETRYLWQMVESLPTMRDSYNPEDSQSSMEGLKNGPIYASPGELTQSEEEIIRSQETSSLNTTSSGHSLPRKVGSPLPDVPVSDRDEESLTSPTFSVEMSDNEEDLDDLLMLETEVLGEEEENEEEEEHRYSMPLPKSERIVPDQGEQFESTPSPEVVEEEVIVPQEEKNHVYATMGPFQDEDEEIIDETTGERVYDMPPDYLRDNQGDPEMLCLNPPPITDIDDLINSDEESESSKPQTVRAKGDDIIDALKMLTDDDAPVVQENHNYDVISCADDEEQDSEMPEEELRHLASSPEKDGFGTRKPFEIEEDFASTPMIPALTPPTDSSSFDFGLPDSKNSTMDFSISSTPMLPPLPFDSSPEMTPPPPFTSPPPVPATLPPPLRSPSKGSINETPIKPVIVKETESCPDGYAAITPVDASQTFAAPPEIINEPLYVDPDANDPIDNTKLGSAVDNIFSSALGSDDPDGNMNLGVDGVVRRVRPSTLAPLPRPPTAFRDDSSSACSSPEKSIDFTPPSPFMDGLGLETKSISGESSSSLDISDTSDSEYDDEEPPIVSPLTIEIPPSYQDFSTIHGPEEEIEKRRLNKSFSTGSSDGRLLLKADLGDVSSSSDDDDDELNLSVQTARRQDISGISDADTSRTSIENVPLSPVSEPVIQPKTLSPVLAHNILSEHLPQLHKSDSSGSELDLTSPRLPPDGHEFPEASTCQSIALTNRVDSPPAPKDVTSPSSKTSPDGSAQAALVQAVQKSPLPRPRNFEKPILPKKPLLPGASSKPATSPKPSPRTFVFGSDSTSPRKSPPATLRGVDISPSGSFEERAAKFGTVLKKATPPISPRSTPPMSPRNTPPMSPDASKPGSPPRSPSKSSPRIASPKPKSSLLSPKESPKIPVVEEVIAVTKVESEKLSPTLLLSPKSPTGKVNSDTSDSAESSPRSDDLDKLKNSVPPLKMSDSPVKPSILDSKGVRSASPSPKLKGLSVPKKLSSTTSTSQNTRTGMPKVGLGYTKSPPVLLPVKPSTGSSQPSSNANKPKLNVKRFSWGTGKNDSDKQDTIAQTTAPSVENQESTKVEPKQKPMMPLRRLHGGVQNPLKPLKGDLNRAEPVIQSDIVVNRAEISQSSPPPKSKAVDMPKLNRKDRPDSGIGTLEKDRSAPMSQSPPSSKPVLPPKPNSPLVSTDTNEEIPPALPAKTSPPALPAKTSPRSKPDVTSRKTETPPPLPSSPPPPLPTSSPPKVDQSKAVEINGSSPVDSDADSDDEAPPALPSKPPPSLCVSSPSSDDSHDVSLNADENPEEGVLEIKVRIIFSLSLFV